ncbi:MAG: hypothetical protein BWY76_02541 [bacterium ADurb.Bin429]|nr:MAG: hypothetical protein BWY76_02541 [bacterium ADurb.Bin429]
MEHVRPNERDIHPVIGNEGGRRQRVVTKEGLPGAGITQPGISEVPQERMHHLRPLRHVLQEVFVPAQLHEDIQRATVETREGHCESVVVRVSDDLPHAVIIRDEQWHYPGPREIERAHRVQCK